MAKLSISHEDYKSIGKNAIQYQTKLENQSRATGKLIEEIEAVWNGKNAKKTIEALKRSEEDFKNMADMIQPYITEYKKLTAQFAQVYGEID